MSELTPAPWHVIADMDGPNLWIYGPGTPGRAVVCMLPDTPQGRVNARLIAAAPSLLDAAHEAVATLTAVIAASAEGSIAEREATIGRAQIRAAIAKAEGICSDERSAGLGGR